MSASCPKTLIEALHHSDEAAAWAWAKLLRVVAQRLRKHPCARDGALQPEDVAQDYVTHLWGRPARQRALQGQGWGMIGEDVRRFLRRYEEGGAQDTCRRWRDHLARRVASALRDDAAFEPRGERWLLRGIDAAQSPREVRRSELPTLNTDLERWMDRATPALVREVDLRAHLKAVLDLARGPIMFNQLVDWTWDALTPSPQAAFAPDEARPEGASEGAFAGVEAQLPLAQRLLDALPTRTRQALSARLGADMTVRELAAWLGVSHGTADGEVNARTGTLSVAVRAFAARHELDAGERRALFEALAMICDEDVELEPQERS